MFPGDVTSTALIGANLALLAVNCASAWKLRNGLKTVEGTLASARTMLGKAENSCASAAHARANVETLMAQARGLHRQAEAELSGMRVERQQAQGLSGSTAGLRSHEAPAPGTRSYRAAHKVGLSRDRSSRLEFEIPSPRSESARGGDTATRLSAGAVLAGILATYSPGWLGTVTNIHPETGCCGLSFYGMDGSGKVRLSASDAQTLWALLGDALVAYHRTNSHSFRLSDGSKSDETSPDEVLK